MFAFSMAPLIAAAPNFGAGTPAKLHKKLPIGVRTADMIYTSFMLFVFIFLMFF